MNRRAEFLDWSGVAVLLCLPFVLLPRVDGWEGLLPLLGWVTLGAAVAVWASWRRGPFVEPWSIAAGWTSALVHVHAVTSFNTIAASGGSMVDEELQMVADMAVLFLVAGALGLVSIARFVWSPVKRLGWGLALFTVLHAPCALYMLGLCLLNQSPLPGLGLRFRMGLPVTLVLGIIVVLTAVAAVFAWRQRAQRGALLFSICALLWCAPLFVSAKLALDVLFIRSGYTVQVDDLPRSQTATPFIDRPFGLHRLCVEVRRGGELISGVPTWEWDDGGAVRTGRRASMETVPTLAGKMDVLARAQQAGFQSVSRDDFIIHAAGDVRFRHVQDMLVDAQERGVLQVLLAVQATQRRAPSWFERLTGVHHGTPSLGVLQLDLQPGPPTERLVLTEHGLRLNGEEVYEKGLADKLRNAADQDVIELVPEGDLSYSRVVSVVDAIRSASRLPRLAIGGE